MVELFLFFEKDKYALIINVCSSSCGDLYSLLPDERIFHFVICPYYLQAPVFARNHINSRNNPLCIIR